MQPVCGRQPRSLLCAFVTEAESAQRRRLTRARRYEQRLEFAGTSHSIQQDPKGQDPKQTEHNLSFNDPNKLVNVPYVAPRVDDRQDWVVTAGIADTMSTRPKECSHAAATLRLRFGLAPSMFSLELTSILDRGWAICPPKLRSFTHIQITPPLTRLTLP